MLTGQEIKKSINRGDIIITPYCEKQINPNSYNFRLNDTLIKLKNHDSSDTEKEIVHLSEEGYVLKPNFLYLGSTYEIIGSDKYTMTLLGKSSIGRLGIFLNSTADLGHSGSISQWTLEISVVQPVKIYPKILIGQISFWLQFGQKENYKGKYYYDLGPIQSKEILNKNDTNW